MQQKLDLRILKIGIEVDGVLKTYQDLAISVSGKKFANANQNECEVKIYNLDKATQDYILSETSPFNKNRTPKLLTVDAGRESYGTTRVFSGDIITSKPEKTPDISIILKSLTKNSTKQNIVARNKNGMSQLSQISRDVANDLGVSLNFQAQEKQISNYSYTGGALNQVDEIGNMGDIDAYIDNDILIVKDARIPLTGVSTVVSEETGMIDIPEITEQGIKVKYLLNGDTQLGGSLLVDSKIYPAVNGRYVIYKLGFELENRDTKFYWIAEGIRQ